MELQNSGLTYTDGDVDTNTSANPHLWDVAGQQISRRQTMTGMAAAGAAFFGSSLLAACDTDDDSAGLPPFSVDAGRDLTTSAGKVVNLAAGLTATGPSTTGGFTQVSGPAVTLTNAGTLNASFTAPTVSAPTTLVFRFAATPQSGSAVTDDVSVVVNPASLGFAAVAKNQNDVVTVPADHTVTVLYRTGDPLLTGVSAYANNGSDTNFAGRAGDHHDGMSYFGLAATGATIDATSSTRGLLVMNHENINQQYLHTGPATTTTPRPTGEVQKEMEAHGVSVVEINRSSGSWTYVQGGALNRRITPYTPMTFSGPVAGNALLFTAYSPTGVAGRGTINNCANGTVPWGSYLTNEENWAGYFRRDAGDNARRTAAVGARSVVAFTRYGLNTGTGDALRAGNFSWTTAAPIASDTTGTLISKFNATTDAAQPANGTGDFRNEPNQYGWVVEIDPFNATSTPRKRTALGRMNHEGCMPGKFVAGRKPAWYMGDDAQNEYLYKFVSSAVWADADASSTDRLATGDKYLNAGTLYVAKFNSDGTGAWLALTFGTGPLTAANPAYAFDSQADVLTHARLAGDALGATKMDRPEWTTVNPQTGEMYLTLTNNTSRTPAGGANPTDVPNPRAYTDPKINGAAATNGNANGHILRLRETGDTTEATTFTWDVYIFGAGRDLDPANINLSGLDDSNDFSSPDGLWFGRASNPQGGSPSPVLWIETDDSMYTDVTNCMLLAAQPGITGDGTTKTITNTVGAVSGTQLARYGKQPGATLRRFLVGCKECEITGIDTTPDGKTVFVNIQHPGELGTTAAPSSNWPANQATGTVTPTGGRPRSATIAITKNDGGVVAL